MKQIGNYFASGQQLIRKVGYDFFKAPRAHPRMSLTLIALGALSLGYWLYRSYRTSPSNRSIVPVVQPVVQPVAKAVIQPVEGFVGLPLIIYQLVIQFLTYDGKDIKQEGRLRMTCSELYRRPFYSIQPQRLLQRLNLIPKKNNDGLAFLLCPQLQSQGWVRRTDETWSKVLAHSLFSPRFFDIEKGNTFTDHCPEDEKRQLVEPCIYKVEFNRGGHKVEKAVALVWTAGLSPDHAQKAFGDLNVGVQSLTKEQMESRLRRLLVDSNLRV